MLVSLVTPGVYFLSEKHQPCSKTLILVVKMYLLFRPFKLAKVRIWRCLAHRQIRTPGVLTPTPSGYPWVPGGQEVTQEPIFRSLVLDHQVLIELRS